ncbi:transposase [Pseudomonas sp. CC6-YY-74]|uniref:transposase n=1 Tax=Pseudomonas sp. CC6-YY-74 TaxID=1930532 RepID=UPI001C43958D|nr:transposase [Pseudomonas sp. CC6-YY-74]
MPRKQRMYLPGVPAHVVPRGNNRDACFFHEDDYRFYLAVLAEGLKRYRVALHAYVLMTPADETGISRVMQHVGRMYVLYINRTYQRTGTLWEGRHKASLVNAAEYLLSCYRYIELNPVRAGLVAAPEAYPWSSYRWHGWGRQMLWWPIMRSISSWAETTRAGSMPIDSCSRGICRPRRYMSCARR